MQKDQVYNMSKFTSLLFCAVAVLNSIYAMPPEIQNIMLECSMEYGVTNSNIEAVMDAKDTTVIEPCFWGCILKRTGFINVKGEYDLDTGLTFIGKNGVNERENALMKETAMGCASVKDKAVSDGEAGCERGALLAACFMDHMKVVENQAHL